MRLVPSILLVASLFAAPLVAQNVDVEEYVLDNGMRWLLLPRYEEPNMISCGWVAQVGSVNERPGITGISHFFEHMMFKGTTTIGTRDAEADADFMNRQKAVKQQINAIAWGEQYTRYLRGEIDDPWDAANDTDELRALRAELKQLMEEHKDVIVKNEFDSIYTNAGASGMNAFTSEDVTFYIINLPSNKFELFAWMESDRLTDSVFREFYSERDVVHEERRMRLESSPTGVLDEQFDAMFWQSSPYSWSVIGWPTDLNSYTREDFDAYFDIYYRPNNLIGVVVGDFQPDELKAQIDQYFAPIPRGEIAPPPVVTLEVEQLAEKRLSGECDCQDQVEVRYHSVPFMHEDEYALEMLAEVLNGRTGRLYKAMVEGAEIASSAGVFQDSRKYAGSFSFAAQTKGDAAPGQLEAAWYEIKQQLIDEPVTEQELQKVKNQVAADSYRRLRSNNSLKIQLGIFAALGDWTYINQAPRKMAEVTAADIQHVAAKYFTETNRCVATYTRREGASAPDDVLMALAPEMREQAKQMIAQLSQIEDAATLEGILGQIQSQASMVPEEAKPMMDYVVQKLTERLEVLKSGGEG
jgi:predicted Zn-dependent peptidase